MADRTDGPRFEDRPGTTLPELQRATIEYSRQLRHASMGYVLKDVVVTAGQNSIAHGLGRVPSAWFVTQMFTSGLGGEYPSKWAASTATQLFLNCEIDTTVDILVIP